MRTSVNPPVKVVDPMPIPGQNPNSANINAVDVHVRASWPLPGRSFIRSIPTDVMLSGSSPSMFRLEMLIPAVSVIVIPSPSPAEMVASCAV